MDSVSEGSEAAPMPWSLAARRSSAGDRDERRLIRAARSGSPEAAEELVRRHWREAYRTALLLVRDGQIAEDIAQEAMLSALGALQGFDHRRPLGPWLRKITTNRALDWLRSPAARGGEALDVGDRAPDPGPPGTVSDPDLLAALWRLSDDERSAVVLTHVLGYRAAEVADALGIPAATVRGRVHRGLKRLRAELSVEEGR